MPLTRRRKSLLCGENDVFEGPVGQARAAPTYVHLAEGRLEVGRYSTMDSFCKFSEHRDNANGYVPTVAGRENPANQNFWPQTA